MDCDGKQQEDCRQYTGQRAISASYTQQELSPDGGHHCDTEQSKAEHGPPECSGLVPECSHCAHRCNSIGVFPRHKPTSREAEQPLTAYARAMPPLSPPQEHTTCVRAGPAEDAVAAAAAAPHPLPPASRLPRCPVRSPRAPRHARAASVAQRSAARNPQCAGRTSRPGAEGCLTAPSHRTEGRWECSSLETPGGPFRLSGWGCPSKTLCPPKTEDPRSPPRAGRPGKRIVVGAAKRRSLFSTPLSLKLRHWHSCRPPIRDGMVPPT